MKNAMDESMLLSPNAMAEAALAEGVKDRKRRDTENKSISKHAVVNDHNVKPNRSFGDHVIAQVENASNDFLEPQQLFHNDLPERKRQRLTDTNYEQRQSDENKSLPMAKLESIWNFLKPQRAALSNSIDQNEESTDEEGSCNSNEMEPMDKAELALDQTLKILMTEMDAMIHQGVKSFDQNDVLERELVQLKDLNESREREIQRLRASEADSRSSLTNLLEAVEASKANAHNASRAARTETSLRNEISTLKLEKEKVAETYIEAQRKMTLVEKEVGLLKSRVERLTQDKVKIERDSRAALSLARSMDSHASSDVHYYKRKVSELNDHLHSRNTLIAELKQKVYEYKIQTERTSHNRLVKSRS